MDDDSSRSYLTSGVIDSTPAPMHSQVMDTADSTDSTEGVIARYARAWADADLVTVIETYAEDVVAHYGGQSPFAGTHIGRDRFLEVLAATAAQGERTLISVDQHHEDGQTGALFATESFVADGETRTVMRGLRFRIENDKIAECWLFDHDQHVVDAAWS